MDYLESDHQSFDGNNVEEILDIIRSEEGVTEIVSGTNIEEIEPCEEVNAENPKGSNEQEKSNDESDEEEVDTVPRLGLKFSTEEEAYDFYNSYAASIGFSIRRGNIRRTQKGVPNQRSFVCSKEGLKFDAEPYEAQRDNRLETRTDCKAYLRVSVINGLWEVDRFNPDHNHKLAPPEQRIYLRSARKLFETAPIIIKVPSSTDKSEASEVIKMPSIGMKVSCENEAYNLYNLYATDIGFSIRKGANRFNSKGELRQRNYVCSKQGLRLDDEPDRTRKVNRAETRTDCKASIRFTITDGVWEVTYFNPEHNHELVNGDQKKYLRSIRRIFSTHTTLTTPPPQPPPPTPPTPTRTMTKSCADSVKISSSNSQNLLQTKRPIVLQAGDGQSLINCLMHKLVGDAMFFYSVQVDPHNRLANFFWRDGRSRLDYDYFGDVIVFDTSYRTMKYDLICAPFMGINHHGEDILFGCAFLSDESISSFSWLFKTFLEAMGDRHPKTIFTNESQELANAISNVLPKTCHLYCLRNIQEYAIQNLPNLYSNPVLKKKFEKCLNGCYSEIDFQYTWDGLIEGHEENEPLKILYNIRLKWCPAFSLDAFSANLRSTQKIGRNMNIFNHNSCKTMDLIQLIDHYDMNAERMRLAELQIDLPSNQDVPTRASRNSAMLKQAADAYTAEIFNIFQEEMVESLSIFMNELSSKDESHTYELIEEGHDIKYKVHFKTDTCTITCSCKMFESMGLLCRHALRVLNMKNVTKLPTRYILKRWTKGARKGISLFKNIEETRSYIRSRLMQKAFCAVDKCMQTTKGSDIANSVLDKIIEQADREIAALNADDIYNGDNDSTHDSAANGTDCTPCSYNSSPVVHASSTRPKNKLDRKRKRKHSSSNIYPVYVAPPGVLCHPQYPSFFHPSFRPPVVGANAIPYALNQGQPPTWAYGNIRPGNVLPDTNHTHANKELSKTSDTKRRIMPKPMPGNGAF